MNYKSFRNLFPFFLSWCDDDDAFGCENKQMHHKILDECGKIHQARGKLRYLKNVELRDEICWQKIDRSKRRRIFCRKVKMRDDWKIKNKRQKLAATLSNKEVKTTAAVGLRENSNDRQGLALEKIWKRQPCNERERRSLIES
ncbi:unnamed protein product, partial [Trichogramma brassicae]